MNHPPMTIFVTEKPEYVVKSWLSKTPIAQALLEREIRDDGSIEFEYGSDDIWHDDADMATGYDPIDNIHVPEFVAELLVQDPADKPAFIIVRSIDCSIVLDDGTAAPLLYTEAKGLHIGTNP